ncbi:MAG: hypothetical protein II838_13475 [Lachnospiraceae bacterium]|nr:hypothetical protein [Lachnospiraceae bacterium]
MSHWVRYSKTVPFGSIIRKRVCTCSIPPFYVIGKGFVRAGKLEAGDEILTSGGQKISIEKIEIEVLAEPVYVYNFTVEDFHTYFVSELGVWGHNTCLVLEGGSGSDLHGAVRHTGGASLIRKGIRP